MVLLRVWLDRVKDCVRRERRESILVTAAPFNTLLTFSPPPLSRAEQNRSPGFQMWMVCDAQHNGNIDTVFDLDAL